MLVVVAVLLKLAALREQHLTVVVAMLAHQVALQALLAQLIWAVVVVALFSAALIRQMAALAVLAW